MNYRRLLAIFVVILVAVGSAFGSGQTGETGQLDTRLADAGFNGTGLPITDNVFTFDIMVIQIPLHGKPFEEMTTVTELESRTNIKINWTPVPISGWVEKRNLAFASQQLPDIFLRANLGRVDVQRYGSQGVLHPLGDLVANWAPRIDKVLEDNPQYRNSSTAPDGNIYALPIIDEVPWRPYIGRGMAINKSWLDKAGLDVPKTTDELLTAAETWIKQDVNNNGKKDEIPVAVSSIANLGLILSSFGIPVDSDFTYIKDDVVRFSASEPEYKKGIQFLRRLFLADGLDAELYAQNQAQYESKGQGVDSLYGAIVGGAKFNAVGNDRYYADFVRLAPLAGPNTEPAFVPGPEGSIGGALCLPIVNEYPEIAMRWLNELVEFETSIQWAWGPIGYNLDKLSDGRIGFRTTPEGIGGFGRFRHADTPGAFGYWITTAEQWVEHIGSVEGTTFEQDLKDAEFYAEYVTTKYEDFPKHFIYYSSDEVDPVTTYETDIIGNTGYVVRKQADWILKGGIEEEWDEYLETLEKMGLSELLEIYQKAYNRFNAK
ncbi:MAG: extracellular solute-binding protein [Spirochaetales bacterium]|jgi:putative aldouronate transport system substrate-binding protein|nr:extracellular solute-binding protein [Spirochaetales bacterium]